MKIPRFSKIKFKITIFTPELFERFKKEHEIYKDMTWEEFEKRWDEICETIQEETVKNPLGVKLSGFLGELKYQYLPYKIKTLEKYINLNTRGKIGKIKWERRWAVKFNKILQFYGFTPNRKMTSLAKNYTDESPEKLRVSRITTGGPSVWRQKK